MNLSFKSQSRPSDTKHIGSYDKQLLILFIILTQTVAKLKDLLCHLHGNLSRIVAVFLVL